jgi:chromosome segregation ATPase
MKRMMGMAIGALLVFGVNLAWSQSLGDVARSMRKNKAQQATTNHKYDNDNMPKTDHLSVVGAATTANADGMGGDASAQNQAPGAQTDPKAAAEERQQAAAEWKNKLDDQQKKIDDLAHELDLAQREYKLRAAVMYADAGNRLRNASTWDKEDADYKKQIEEKQKALDAAKQELSDIKEQARKAGAPAAKE